MVEFVSVIRGLDRGLDLGEYGKGVNVLLEEFDMMSLFMSVSGFAALSSDGLWLGLRSERSWDSGSVFWCRSEGWKLCNVVRCCSEGLWLYIVPYMWLE